MTLVHVPQIYYWRVDFEDSTYLAQFDDFGNEILIKNIADSECFLPNGTVKEFSNYFAKYEKIHGRVKLFGFYPFTEEMMRKIHAKDPSIVFAISKEALPITKEIPPEFYASYKKVNLISYGLNTDSPISGRIGKLVIALVHRESAAASLYEINMVQVKA